MLVAEIKPNKFIVLSDFVSQNIHSKYHKSLYYNRVFSTIIA